MRSSSHLFGGSDYISIIITSYFRPFYLKKCLESLEKYADLPYEVIVHDDGSSPKIRQELIKMSDKISTLILNLGTNMGLNISVNRCVQTAQSEYILFLNDDCFLTKPCFKKIIETLKHPYISWISPTNTSFDSSNKKNGFIKTRDKVYLSNDWGGGHCVAFRKQVWEDVGGWCEWNTTGQSDNVFLLKTIKAGYFKGILKDGPYIGNIHPHTEGYLPATNFSKGVDCSYPKLFGLTPKQQLYLAWKRREYCQLWVDGERTIANRHTFDNRENPVAGLNDFHYWDDYLKRIIKDGVINWEEAKLHGQDKWRVLIERSVN